MSGALVLLYLAAASDFISVWGAFTATWLLEHWVLGIAALWGSASVGVRILPHLSSWLQWTFNLPWMLFDACWEYTQKGYNYFRHWRRLVVPDVVAATAFDLLTITSLVVLTVKMVRSLFRVVETKHVRRGKTYKTYRRRAVVQESGRSQVIKSQYQVMSMFTGAASLFLIPLMLTQGWTAASSTWRTVRSIASMATGALSLYTGLQSFDDDVVDDQGEESESENDEKYERRERSPSPDAAVIHESGDVDEEDEDVDSQALKFLDKLEFEHGQVRGNREVRYESTTSLQNAALLGGALVAGYAMHYSEDEVKSTKDAFFAWVDALSPSAFFKKGVSRVKVLSAKSVIYIPLFFILLYVALWWFTKQTVQYEAGAGSRHKRRVRRAFGRQYVPSSSKDDYVDLDGSEPEIDQETRDDEIDRMFDDSYNPIANARSWKTRESSRRSHPQVDKFKRNLNKRVSFKPSRAELERPRATSREASPAPRVRKEAILTRPRTPMNKLRPEGLGIVFVPSNNNWLNAVCAWNGVVFCSHVFNQCEVNEPFSVFFRVGNDTVEVKRLRTQTRRIHSDLLWMPLPKELQKVPQVSLAASSNDDLPADAVMVGYDSISQFKAGNLSMDFGRITRYESEVSHGVEEKTGFYTVNTQGGNCAGLVYDLTKAHFIGFHQGVCDKENQFIAATASLIRIANSTTIIPESGNE